MKAERLQLERFRSFVALLIIISMLFVPLSALAETDPEPDPQFEAEVDVDQDSVVPVDLSDITEPIDLDDLEEGDQVGFTGAEFDFEFHEVGNDEIGGVYIDPLFDGDFIIMSAETTDATEATFGSWSWSTDPTLAVWSSTFGDPVDSKINDGDSLWLKADNDAVVSGDKWLEVTLEYLGILVGTVPEPDAGGKYEFENIQGSAGVDSAGNPLNPQPLHWEVMAWTTNDSDKWYGLDYNGVSYPINQSIPNPDYEDWVEINKTTVKTGETAGSDITTDLTGTGVSGFIGPFGGSSHVFHNQYGSAIDGNKVDHGSGTGSATVDDLTTYTGYGWDSDTNTFTSIGTEASNRISDNETVIEWSIVDGKLTWNVVSGGVVYEVFVKGGSEGARIYYYENGATSGTGLTTQTDQDISHFGFITGPRKTETVPGAPVEEFADYFSAIISSTEFAYTPPRDTPVNGGNGGGGEIVNGGGNDGGNGGTQGGTQGGELNGGSSLGEFIVGPETPATSPLALPSTGGVASLAIALGLLLAGSGILIKRKNS